MQIYTSCRSSGFVPSFSSSYFFIFTLSLYFTIAFADPLLDTIESIPELSIFNGLITGNKNLTSLFQTVKDFTLLAPSNEALTQWVDPSMPASIVEATMRYHLLKQGFTTEQFSEESIFAPSYLESKAFTNVSLGQAVELVTKNGKESALSANHTESTITIRNRIATGGLIHVISRVLTIPSTLTMAISDLNLPIFATILNVGGFVDQDSSAVVKKVVISSDLTFFAPNTKAALDSMTTEVKKNTRQQQEALFAYHCVPGVIYSNELEDGMQLPTLIPGKNLTVSVIDADIYVDGAKLLARDNLIANGVLHTIDNLNLPDNPSKPVRPAETPTPTPTPNPSPSGGGLSTGAKAGIAIGVIALIVGIIALLIFFAWRRRAQHHHNNGTRGLHDDSSQRELDKVELSDRSGGTTEIGGQQVIGNHIGHHIQQDYSMQRRATGDGDLEVDRRRSERVLELNVNKQWEYRVDVVELDGSNGKY